MTTPVREDQHGTHTGYLKGCRCAGCRDANRLYQREYRARKRMGTYDFRSFARDAEPTALERVLERVGQDIPTFSAIARELAVMSA